MKKDIIEKNETCQCEDCKCYPCKCGTTGMGSKGCCAGGKYGFWAAVRIAIVVLLIVGAFAVGARLGEGRSHWMGNNGYNYGPKNYRSDRGDDASEMMREHMRMMKNGGMMSMNGMDSMSGMDSDDMMSMSMADMSKMLEGKTGDALDRAFLEGMIPHHQGAVDMAKYLVNAKHPELQKMGQDIIVIQTKEIEQMKQWMKEWGYTATGSTASGMMMNGTMMR